MPGYWTLVTTSVPSGSWARWTWPMLALAIGSGSQRAKTRFGGAPYCSSSTRAIAPLSTAGALARRSARTRW